MTQVSITITGGVEVMSAVITALQAAHEPVEVDVTETPAMPAWEPTPPPAPMDKDTIIQRLLAGDRSPELLAAIDDPAVSVPEQIAAQKVYPEMGLA